MSEGEDKETLRALGIANALESQGKQMVALAAAIRRHAQSPQPVRGVGSPLLHVAMTQMGTLAASAERLTRDMRRLKKDLQVLGR